MVLVPLFFPLLRIDVIVLYFKVRSSLVHVLLLGYQGSLCWAAFTFAAKVGFGSTFEVDLLQAVWSPWLVTRPLLDLQSNGAVGLGVLVNNLGEVTAAGGWLVEVSSRPRLSGVGFETHLVFLSKVLPS